MATEARRLDSVARSIRATLTGDSSVVEELFSPDVRAWLPAPALSPAALAVEIEDRSAAFADVDVGVLQAEVIDTQCWVEWYATVTHVGELAIGTTTLEPTGRRAVLHGFTVAEFDADRIIAYHQSWDYSDLAPRRPSDSPNGIVSNGEADHPNWVIRNPPCIATLSTA